MERSEKPERTVTAAAAKRFAHSALIKLHRLTIKTFRALEDFFLKEAKSFPEELPEPAHAISAS